jgi:hypothetical protein
MDRKERIIRLLSQAAQGKSVKEEGIGKFDPDNGHLAEYHFLFLDEIDDDDL